MIKQKNKSLLNIKFAWKLHHKVNQLKHNVQHLPPPYLTLFNTYLTKYNLLLKVQTNISLNKIQSHHTQISDKFKHLFSLLQISNIRKQQFYNKKTNL